MSKFTSRELTIAGLIAAVYAALSLALAPISFGVYQVRIAEALTVLPFFTRAAIPGLFIGCLLANVIGGLGWLDIVFGSLLTLAAAFFTHLIGRLPQAKPSGLNSAVWLAPLPPVLLNAFGVSAYLAPLIGVPYLFSVQMVGLGQVIACYAIGIPLLMMLQKRRSLFVS